MFLVHQRGRHWYYETPHIVRHLFSVCIVLTDKTYMQIVDQSIITLSARQLSGLTEKHRKKFGPFARANREV